MAPLAPYLCFNGIEVANGNQTAAYLRNGLAGGNFSISDCYCHGLDTDDEEDEVTYTDPASDDAPWYSDDWPAESADFLGFYLDEIRVLPVQRRTVSPLPLGGAAVGRQRLGGRVVQVRGMMYAANSRGMSWGERWLNEVLSGSGCSECGGSTAQVALWCMDAFDVGDIADGAVQGILRELQEVGLVDGPTFTPERGGPECVMQTVSFQLVAGVPWLLADLDTPVETDEDAGGTFVTPTWIGDYAARVQIDATSDMTDVVIRFWPRLAAAPDPDDTEGMPCSEFIISDLREGDRFVIDGIKHAVTLIDGTSKLPSDGWALVDLEHGLPGFPEFGPCVDVRYEIAVASGTADVTWRFMSREL